MSNRRLLERAQRLEIEQKFPELGRGLRKPGQPSKIINREALQASYDREQEAAAAIARERNATQTGQTVVPITAGQTELSGVAGRSVGFNSTASPSPPRRETFAEEDIRTRREKTLSGVFGEQAQAKAENLEGRKGLFAEMRTAATEGGNTSGFRDRAKTLGIDDEGYKRGIARAEGTAVPSPAAPAPTTPLTGRALAEKNISTMGVQGAVADYAERNPSFAAKFAAEVDKETIPLLAAAPTQRTTGRLFDRNPRKR